MVQMSHLIESVIRVKFVLIKQINIRDSYGPYIYCLTYSLGGSAVGEGRGTEFAVTPLHTHTDT